MRPSAFHDDRCLADHICRLHRWNDADSRSGAGSHVIHVEDRVAWVKSHRLHIGNVVVHVLMV